MSFFDEYAGGDGGAELAASESTRSITFSGKDGSYGWTDENGLKQEESSLKKVIAFWNLGGRVLWPGSGPIPSDGSAPLCRTENDRLDIAAMRPSIGPATLDTMAAKGFTGSCATCGLAQFNGDEKPLCKMSATLYVVDPGVELNDKAIHRIVFNGPGVVKILKEKINNLLKHAQQQGQPYAAFVVTLGKEKVKGRGKGDSYCVPTLAVGNEAMPAEWLSVLGVEARIAIDETRRRPSWARDPKSVLASGVVQAALQASRELDGVQMEDIPF